MRVAIGSDHAGFDYRQRLVQHLKASGHQVDEFGAPDTDRFDYPLASDQVAHAVLAGTHDRGILVCGSGIGVCIRANRYPGIRAAQAFTAEMARLSREHNHANVLCVGERVQEYNDVVAIVDTFLDSGEDMGERHVHRVEQLDAPVNE